MRLALAIVLLLPATTAAQVAPLDPFDLPLPQNADDVVTPHDGPVAPDARTVSVEVRTRRPEESLHLVVGYEVPWPSSFPEHNVHVAREPIHRALCTGPCVLTLVVGQYYELMVVPAPGDGRFSTARARRALGITITSRTVALDVTLNPRRAQRRRRWLTLAGMMAVGGAMMGGSAKHHGGPWQPAFSVGLGLLLFTPSLVVIPLTTSGRSEVRAQEQSD